MIVGNVEGDEVVPFVLDFRALFHVEAEPGHDPLELVNRLSQRVPAAEIAASSRQSHIDPGF